MTWKRISDQPGLPRRSERGLPRYLRSQPRRSAVRRWWFGLLWRAGLRRPWSDRKLLRRAGLVDIVSRCPAPVATESGVIRCILLLHRCDYGEHRRWDWWLPLLDVVWRVRPYWPNELGRAMNREGQRRRAAGLPVDLDACKAAARHQVGCCDDTCTEAHS